LSDHTGVTDPKAYTPDRDLEVRHFAVKSPFVNIPSTLRADQRVLLNGIRYSVEMLGVSCQRLGETLNRIADLRQKKEELPQPSIATAFTDAWSIVDTTVRLQKLVQQFPKWNRNSAIRGFVDSTVAARDLRNGFQHLDNELRTLGNTNLPALGTLRWSTQVAGSNSYRIHALWPGTVTSTEVPINDNRVPMSGTVLRAYGHVFDIGAAIEAVDRLVRSLEASLSRQFEGQPGSMADIYFSIDVVPDQSTTETHAK